MSTYITIYLITISTAAKDATPTMWVSHLTVIVGNSLGFSPGMC